MRIALHTPFVLQQNTGIARHILGLLNGIATVDRENEYVCFWPPQAPWPDAFPPNMTPEFLDIGTGGGGSNPAGRILRETAWIARLHRRRPFDLLHSPFGYLPLTSPVPTVNTLHDLRVVRWPQTFSRLRGAFLRWAMPRAVRQANRTLAISEATRQEALALVKGVTPERIETIYPGVDARWRTPVAPSRVEDVRRRFGLDSPYLLAVSTREPHKNLPRFIQAFALARRDYPTLKLALAGATFQTGISDDVQSRVEEAKLEASVLGLGIVSDDDLAALYAGTDAFCFPSLYEGFGLPPLEALASGAPVLTSNVSCMPEIVGEAAVLADPYSAESLAQGIAEILNRSPAEREAWREWGRAQARRYDWNDYARNVIAAYGRVLNETR